MNYKYNLFVSYASGNFDIANHVVNELEKRKLKCFIAPRDIETGKDYACEIVQGIANSSAVLLIFSKDSNDSHYVLREINSAVSRNKTIIPLRIEDFLPSEAMEFYLGPTHWLDAFPEVLDIHIDRIVQTLGAITKTVIGESEAEKTYVYEDTSLVKLEDAVNKMGITYRDITIKEIEIDYLTIPDDKYNMNESTNGTFDDWKDAAENYENDTSILLIKKDEIIGYCDVYPVDKDSFESLIKGEVIIRDSMIDVFCIGGTFDVYIAMLAIVPEQHNQVNILMVLDWVIEKIDAWRQEDIFVNNIGISVYSALLEKFIIKLGFKFASINPAKGKVYVTNIEDLKNNPLVKTRHPNFMK